MAEKKKEICKYEHCERERWRNDEYCVFHSEDVEGKKEDLREALKKVLDNHQQWLGKSNKKGVKAYLREANLQGADLRSANLKETNLWRANLSGSIFRSANLTKANLCSANLERADMILLILYKSPTFFVQRIYYVLTGTMNIKGAGFFSPTTFPAPSIKLN
jgi:uncharacterized protein YjbI with pentapeptide repeats